jgi:hypothetical protein
MPTFADRSNRVIEFCVQFILWQIYDNTFSLYLGLSRGRYGTVLTMDITSLCMIQRSRKISQTLVH